MKKSTNSPPKIHKKERWRRFLALSLVTNLLLTALSASLTTPPGRAATQCTDLSTGGYGLASVSSDCKLGTGPYGSGCGRDGKWYGNDGTFHLVCGCGASKVCASSGGGGTIVVTVHPPTVNVTVHPPTVNVTVIAPTLPPWLQNSPTPITFVPTATPLPGHLLTPKVAHNANG